MVNILNNLALIFLLEIFFKTWEIGFYFIEAFVYLLLVFKKTKI